MREQSNKSDFKQTEKAMEIAAELKQGHQMNNNLKNSN